jgi:hypothetical protein
MKPNIKRDWKKTSKKSCSPASFTEEEDNVIRETYGKQKHPIKYLCNFSSLADKYTRAQFQYRATTIGVASKPKRFPFTEKEVKLMTGAMGEKSVPEMVAMLKRAGFTNRNAKHVRMYIYRHGGGSVRSDRYSARELCSFFRCTTNQLKKWDKQKLLVPSGKYENDTKFFYKPMEVARFIRYHSFELENYRVDIPWLVSLFEEFWSRINDLPKKKQLGNDKLKESEFL